MTENASNNTISLQALVHVRNLEFDFIHIAQLFIEKFKHLAHLSSLNYIRAVLKGVLPIKAQLQQPMPD